MKNELALIIFGRFFVAVAGLFALRIMTHYMPPERYGELSLLVVIQSMCGLILVNPVGQYLNVNTHKWYDEGSLFSRLNSYRIYLFVVSLIAALLLFLIMSETIESLLISAFALLIVVWSVNWNNTLVPLLNMLDARIASVVWSIITVVMATVSSTLFIIYFEPSAHAWLLGQAIGMFLGILGSKYSLRKFMPIAKKEKSVLITRKVFVSFCLPLSFATFFMWFSQNGYRFFVEYYWGLAALAFFVVGFQVATALWSIVETIAMQFLHPYYYRASSDITDGIKLQSALSDFVNTLIPLYIFLSAIMMLGANQIIYLLVDSQYHSAKDFFYFAVIVELVRVSSNVIGHAVQVKRKTKMLILPYFLYAIIMLVSVIVSGYFEFDMHTFVFSIFISSVLFFVSMFFQMRRLISYKVNWRSIFYMSSFLFLVVIYVFYVKSNSALTVFSSIYYLFSLGCGALLFIIYYLKISKPLKRFLEEKII
ncbi:hypothetical protein OFY17_01950 [Marinomonas sp. C2222]|uniref:Polysaccharide biosynthesis protein n=1 Tax=Marinomonas sargassi TaxID=2984494 RepID=A0ABT2YP29_9GAMM|nr:hypothetical protein [Marinomonas sargassi]MCV2401636.1 hypothetical protein [Marinomonas sargassi]